MTTDLTRRAVAAVKRRNALAASWRRLSWAERREFALFAALIPAIKLALHTIGFRRTHAMLEAFSRNGTATPEPTRDVSVRGLRRARRYALYRGNCLPQSLALWWRLRRQGCHAELCLGAKLDDGELAAHAWVEANGRILNDTQDVRRRFTPFQSADFRRAAP